MQNIIDFFINNKIVVIIILIFMVCVIIGFFGNMRLEKKKKNESSKNDNSNANVNSKIEEAIDALDVNPNNNISFESQNIDNINRECNNVQISSTNQNTNEQMNSNNSTITSNFFIPDDDNINNIF